MSSSGGGGGLQQTFDWSSALSTGLTCTYNLLAAYSSGKIDAYTGQLGQLICSQFELSREGREHIDRAIDSLPSVSINRFLLVGFGPNGAVRQLRQTNEGCTLLALCGVLSESYHDHLAPAALHELCKLANPPENVRFPSISQWKALLQAVAGILSTTEFALNVEALIQLHPQHSELRAFAGIRGEDRRTVAIASPESVARTLRALGDLSKGKDSLTNITVIGGVDIAWLAVLAEHFLGLRIDLRHERSDLSLYSSSEHEAQVTFVFQAISGADGREVPQELRVSQRTYILEDASQILVHRHSRNYHPTSNGRLAWGKIFSRAFGGPFQKLLGKPNVLASVCGSFARLSQAVVMAEADVPDTLIAGWTHYSFESYGSGFVGHLVTRFPELQKLQLDMFKAATSTFSEALQAYETGIGFIQNLCDCQLCARNLENPRRFCMVAIVETILSFGLLMSETEVWNDLLPKHAGVFALYEMQMGSASRASPIELPPSFQLFNRVWADRGGIQTQSVILNDLGTLFTGYHWGQREETDAAGCSAASNHGICVFMDLLSGEFNGLETVGKISICPGAIVHREFHVFSKISDPVRNSPKYPSISPMGTCSNPTLKISETLDGLELWFDLPVSQGEASIIARLRPVDFRRMVLGARGWTECDGQTCTDVHPVDPNNRDGEIEKFGQRIRLVTANTLVACALIVVSRGNRTVLVKGNECVQCAIRTVFDNGPATHLRHQMHNSQWLIVGDRTGSRTASQSRFDRISRQIS